MKNYVGFACLFLCFCGCAALGIDTFLDRGHYDEHGQYVPKRPRFKLKNKKNNIFPLYLDTINVYCAKFNSPTNSGGIRYNGYEYFKFYGNGKCFNFILIDNDTLYKKRILQEADLNPNSRLAKKCYYFSRDGVAIQIEEFWKADYGAYAVDNFYLSTNGDTLVDKSNSLTKRFIRQEIPKHWKKYKVDW